MDAVFQLHHSALFYKEPSMADEEVLQAGTRVKIDSKGNKTYEPMRVAGGVEAGDSPSAHTLGQGAAANAAKTLKSTIRSQREEIEAQENGTTTQGQ
jgi:hypothetical protein